MTDFELTATVQGGCTSVLIRLPDGWHAAPPGAVAGPVDAVRLVGLPEDARRFAASGFVPNINVTLVPGATQEILPTDNQAVVLGECLTVAPDGSARTFSLSSIPYGSLNVIQLTSHVTVRRGDSVAELVVVCSAADDDWAELAEVFDEFGESSIIALVEATR